MDYANHTGDATFVDDATASGYETVIGNMTDEGRDVLVRDPAFDTSALYADSTASVYGTAPTGDSTYVDPTIHDGNAYIGDMVYGYGSPSGSFDNVIAASQALAANHYGHAAGGTLPISNTIPAEQSYPAFDPLGHAVASNDSQFSGNQDQDNVMHDGDDDQSDTSDDITEESIKEEEDEEDEEDELEDEQDYKPITVPDAALRGVDPPAEFFQIATFANADEVCFSVLFD